MKFTHKSLDEGFEVRAVFLDISKAFDKVWHVDLLLKINQNAIAGNLLELLCDFLSSRKQRVVLNGQRLSWDNVTPVVPQVSILGPLLFLIYIKIYLIISPQIVNFLPMIRLFFQ